MLYFSGVKTSKPARYAVRRIGAGGDAIRARPPAGAQSDEVDTHNGAGAAGGRPGRLDPERAGARA